jgi:GrpB-like predicted nucleotidyltransferase (UPF0157 family)
MKISIEKYNPKWTDQFSELETKISSILKIFSPTIEHIGSTAVPSLSAKPIIDIAVGLNSKEDLNSVTPLMMANNFVYISAFNGIMPERRFFAYIRNRDDFKSEYSDINNIPNEELHLNKISNIHMWILDSTEWNRHIAFREYLKHNVKVKAEYKILKEKLSNKNWSDGNEYNEAKNAFIKREELNAISWYKEHR